MIRFAVDECLDNDIIRGLVRLRPETDVTRVQDVGLSGADDPTVLAWAAKEGRVLLTHDVATMIRFACDRVAGGQAMPGLIAVRGRCSIRDVVDDLLLVAECAEPAELDGRVLYLPFA
jgi:hypothetical protein